MPGKVYLVGAGPGDPDLLTVRAWRLLREADVVMHDSLAGSEILDLAPSTAEVLDVGKRPGPDGERTTQEEINALMGRKARDGDVVVRLKGGDPTVFGRGGEEAEYLAERDVPVELVPGVSSAVAGPEIVGIPTTHREHASSLTVVTGHEDPTKEESALDWDALAGNVAAGGTLVILMGVGRLPDNAAALREAGVDPETPVAMVEKVTWDDERVVAGTLETIVDVAREAGIEPPAVTVVGDVVSVRERVADALDRGPIDVPERDEPSDREGLDRDDSAGPGGAEQRRDETRAAADAASPAPSTSVDASLADSPPVGRADAEAVEPAETIEPAEASPTVRYPLGPTVEDD